MRKLRVRTGLYGIRVSHLAGVFFVLLFFMSCMAGPLAWAGDDPPARVVRLAYFQGDVTILRADNTIGDPAQLNTPLTEGVRVTTGENGQAEVEFEDGSLIRITPQSAVLLSRLGSSQDGSFDSQITLVDGLVYAELRAAAKYAYRIDAGGDVVTPVANATIRITLDQPPPEIAVLDGTAHVEHAGAGGYQVDVGKGESLRGDAAGGARYFLSQRIEHNSWDDWNEEREQAASNDAAVRTAARDGFAGDQGYGWSDLDANGTWYDTGQGPVWQPFDAGVSGFDPYGYGSWVYTSGAGYVWSSGYRWGWTPFRGGNWNYWPGFGWGWRPGKSEEVRRGGPGWGARWNRINLANVPPGYKRPAPPGAGDPVRVHPGDVARVHPVVPVRTGPPPTGVRGSAFEAKEIGGRTAMPLRTVGGGYTPRGGSAVGASLRRDFPVDRATRQPVMGVATAPVGRREAGASRSVPTQEGTSGEGSRGAGTGFGEARGDGFRGERREGSRGDTVRPGYPGRSGVAPENSSVPAAPAERVRVHPGLSGNSGYGVPQNSVPAPLNQVPAPLHGEPAPINQVPRLPLGPGERPAPVNQMQRLPSGPSERSVPSPPPMRSAPPAAVPAPARSAPAPAAAPSAAAGPARDSKK